MPVSARSVALDGVGFGARHIALAGLVALVAQPNVPAQPACLVGTVRAVTTLAGAIAMSTCIHATVEPTSDVSASAIATSALQSVTETTTDAAATLVVTTALAGDVEGCS